MKNRLFFRLLILAVVTVFAVTSCKDYDDDISKLEAQISDMKKDFPAKIDAAKTELTQAMDTKIKAVNEEIAALKGNLTALEGKVGELEKNSATKAELDAAKKDILAQIEAVKTEILNKTVAKEVFEAFVTKAEAELKALKEELDKKATKEELEAFKGEVAETFAGINAQLEKIMGDIKNLETKHDELVSKHEELADKHDALAKSYADHIEAYNKHIEAFNALKGLHDKLSADHDQLKKEFKDFMGDYDGTVQGIFDKITELKNELEPRIDVLDGVLKIKDGKSETIADIYNKLGEHLKLIKANQEEISSLKKDLEAKYKELVEADKNLQKQIDALVDSVAQHRKDIDTNAANIQINKEDIAKINKYIEEVLKPELKRLNDEIVKLQGRMNKVENAVNLNADNILVLSSRVTDLTFIPTRGLPGEKTIKLYWNAGDYSADHVLMYRVSPASAKVGRDFTVESLNYQITTRGAINDDASEVDIEINGEPTMLEGAKGVLCIPVHLKGNKACDVFEVGKREALTLVLTVKNNPITPSSKDITKPENGKDEVDADNVYVKSSEMVYTEYIHNDILLAELGDGTLAERLLETTEAGAKAFANKPELETPEAKRNWNAMLYNRDEEGIDLYDYVLSYYVDEDGQNHFYDNLGEFGRPYTDKPKYAAPIYEFEIVTEWQGSDPHYIDPQDRYTELVGENKNILRVKKGKVNSSDDKKVIVKVTQVNTKCVERQPVGYLVVKITNDPTQAWTDIHHTFDLTAYPYIHSDIDGYVNDPKLFPFGKNPADIDVVLDKFPTGSIKKEEFWNSTYVTAWPENITYVDGSAVFEPFNYNHVSLSPDKALGFITFEPTRTWGPGDEYQVNSILVKVDKRAPAGMYQVTYKTRYTRGVPAVQAGPDLYITFKFQVGVRQMTVQKDKPMWDVENNILNVQYARLNNDITYKYRSVNGYKVNLTQAFIHDQGTKLITVTTDGTKDHGGKSLDARTQEVYAAKNAPVYAPMFEFIPQDELTKAGFSYESEVINGNEYLTQLMLGDERAAHIIRNDESNDNMVKLYIEYNKAGDALYNWINNIDPSLTLKTVHNIVTIPERLINVRMVTDINDSKVKFNKYYLHDFAVRFERTLHTKFTTIELNDQQQKQTFDFNFITNNDKVKRGLFDNDGNLVSGKEAYLPNDGAKVLADWYNVQTLATLPTNTKRPNNVDYDKVEYSEDGVNWVPIPQDYMVTSIHPTRYFDITWSLEDKKWTAIWQGDKTVSTKDVYFRVPIVNESGMVQKSDAVVFRHNSAKTYGYAVFKIKARNSLK